MGTWPTCRDATSYLNIHAKIGGIYTWCSYYTANGKILDSQADITWPTIVGGFIIIGFFISFVSMISLIDRQLIHQQRETEMLIN